MARAPFSQRGRLFLLAGIAVAVLLAGCGTADDGATITTNGQATTVADGPASRCESTGTCVQVFTHGSKCVVPDGPPIGCGEGSLDVCAGTTCLDANGTDAGNGCLESVCGTGGTDLDTMPCDFEPEAQCVSGGADECVQSLCASGSAHGNAGACPEGGQCGGGAGSTCGPAGCSSFSPGVANRRCGPDIDDRCGFAGIIVCNAAQQGCTVLTVEACNDASCEPCPVLTHCTGAAGTASESLCMPMVGCMMLRFHAETCVDCGTVQGEGRICAPGAGCVEESAGACVGGDPGGPSGCLCLGGSCVPIEPPH